MIVYFDGPSDCSLEKGQVNGYCQSIVLSPVRINGLVSFAVMLLAVRLK